MTKAYSADLCEHSDFVKMFRSQCRSPIKQSLRCSSLTISNMQASVQTLFSSFLQIRVVWQDIVDQQKQLIAKLRSAASKSLPNNIGFTYSQPTRRTPATGSNHYNISAVADLDGEEGTIHPWHDDFTLIS